jgi:hypothetical protein
MEAQDSPAKDAVEVLQTLQELGRTASEVRCRAKAAPQAVPHAVYRCMRTG